VSYVKSLSVHNICCDSNADQNREIVVEHRIGTDHNAESQLDNKSSNDEFNRIRNRPLNFYFLPCAECVKIVVVWQYTNVMRVGV
jgi:hypothetical protein